MHEKFCTKTVHFYKPLCKHHGLCHAISYYAGNNDLKFREPWSKIFEHPLHLCGSTWCCVVGKCEKHTSVTRLPARWCSNPATSGIGLQKTYCPTRSRRKHKDIHPYILSTEFCRDSARIQGRRGTKLEYKRWWRHYYVPHWHIHTTALKCLQSFRHRIPRTPPSNSIDSGCSGDHFPCNFSDLTYWTYCRIAGEATTREAAEVCLVLHHQEHYKETGLFLET